MTFFKMSTYNHAVYQHAKTFLVYSLIRFVCPIISKTNKRVYIFYILIAFQTIIFIRDKNARGQEISGYIDYAHRMKTEEFEPYFAGKKRLLPRPSDLRY